MTTGTSSKTLSTSVHQGASVGVAILDSGPDGNRCALQRMTFCECRHGCVRTTTAEASGRRTHVAGLAAGSGTSLGGLAMWISGNPVRACGDPLPL